MKCKYAFAMKMKNNNNNINNIRDKKVQKVVITIQTVEKKVEFR